MYASYSQTNTIYSLVFRRYEGLYLVVVLGAMKRDVLRAECENRRQRLLIKREDNWSDLGISSYAGARYYTARDGSTLLYEAIKSDCPFFVCRMGETETRMIRMIRRDYLCLNEFRIATHNICNNAGFFPRRIGHIKRFCDLYELSAQSADYLGMMLWKDEEYIMLNTKDLKGCFPSGILDPIYMNDNKWLEALEHKKVLVVSPFAQSINEQYKKREKLFKGKDILKEFDLKVLQAVQSIGGKGAEGYDTWFDALDSMKKKIDEVDFDIALLGCGAYGVPLGSYIKSIQKQAVYVGGCLQLMFGILGRRWENSEYVKEYVNDNWIRPLSQEKPDCYKAVEEGCYW